MLPLLNLDLPVIAALHLPPFRRGRRVDPAYLEDYLLQNLDVFARGGIPAVMIQDETRVVGPAYPETIAHTASLTRLARREFPNLTFGVIVEAHDPQAALAIAAASGASFVRLKVFVGAMLKSSGVQQALGVQAVAYRDLLDRADIRILADVFDRTGSPLGDASLTTAEEWAVQTGADGLVLTGATFTESLDMLRQARARRIGRPLILGGSVTTENVAAALDAADGVIVSSALKRQPTSAADLIHWDLAKVQAFMDAVRQIPATPSQS
jgi:predicted TIM-barrel enzyme